MVWGTECNHSNVASSPRAPFLLTHAQVRAVSPHSDFHLGYKSERRLRQKMDATFRRNPTALQWLEDGEFAKTLGVLGTFEQKPRAGSAHGSD